MILLEPCHIFRMFLVLLFIAGPQRRKIFFEDPRPSGPFAFDGVPFTFNFIKSLECRHGRDRHSAGKKKRDEAMVSVRTCEQV